MAEPAGDSAGVPADVAQHMRAAIALSRRGGLEERTGRCFGAVVVDAAGKVVGEGYNQVRGALGTRRAAGAAGAAAARAAPLHARRHTVRASARAPSPAQTPFPRTTTRRRP